MPKIASVVRALVATLVLAVVPTAASAQSVIVGTVTDTTGAVLPGVTVEARSPVLIEQVKSAVTDGEGQYRIVDLRPGQYSVTFTLGGFNTTIRDGITLPAEFTATIDAQMRIGALEETVTVSGAAPVVDLESTRQARQLTREMADVLPTGRTHRNYAVTVPAISAKIDVGGQGNINADTLNMNVYGMGEAQTVVDGIPINQSTGTTTMFVNSNDFEEFSFTLNGGNAEQPHAGVQSNMIPKSGGNTFSGSGLVLWSHPNLSAQNASAEQIASGLAAPPDIDRLYDFYIGVGGPILRDRLWFYASTRPWTTDIRVNMLHDGRLGSPGEQVVDRSFVEDSMARLMWQMTSKDRLSVTYTREWRWRYYSTPFQEGRTRPEAAGKQHNPVDYWAQLKWTSTVSNKLLVEAGFAPNMRTWTGAYQAGTRTPADFPPYGDVAKFDPTRTQSFYNAPADIWDTHWVRHFYTGSLSYVTGSHALKTGVQFDNGYSLQPRYNPNGGLRQDYRAGVPFGVLIYNHPIYPQTNARNLGFYVQDTWKLNRLTLSPGLRWDKFVGSVPEQSAIAGWWVPERNFAAVSDIPNWSDLAGRFGASYDLFGTSQTALKASVGRYMSREGTTFPSRYNPMILQGDPRDWTDRDLQGRNLPTNGDDIAQLNEIGPSRNPAWGIRPNRNPDPDIQRPSDWLYNVAIEHQLRPGLGVAVGYNRRELKDPSWTDNLTYGPQDYQLLVVADPRGNGEKLPVYQVLPARIGPVNELDKNSTNTQTFNGVDVAVAWRLPNGAFLSGGTSTGRIIKQNCQFENPNWTSTSSPGARFCDEGRFDLPLRTTVKLNGSYPLPWRDFRVSAVVQSLAGAERFLYYTVTRAQLPQLVTASSVVVRLNEPGSEYLERVNMLDLTLAGTIRAGKVRVKPEIAMFNVFNTNKMFSETEQWPTQGRPVAIVPGRLIRLGMQLYF